MILLEGFSFKSSIFSPRLRRGFFIIYFSVIVHHSPFGIAEETPALRKASGDAGSLRLEVNFCLAVVGLPGNLRHE